MSAPEKCWYGTKYHEHGMVEATRFFKSWERGGQPMMRPSVKAFCDIHARGSMNGNWEEVSREDFEVLSVLLP